MKLRVAATYLFVCVFVTALAATVILNQHSAEQATFTARLDRVTVIVDSTNNVEFTQLTFNGVIYRAPGNMTLPTGVFYNVTYVQGENVVVSVAPQNS